MGAKLTSFYKGKKKNLLNNQRMIEVVRNIKILREQKIGVVEKKVGKFKILCQNLIGPRLVSNENVVVKDSIFISF